MGTTVDIKMFPCGKRAVAAPTNYSPATNKTPHLPEDGPTSSGTPSQDGSDLETGTLPCSARDDPSLASRALPFVLEAQIPRAFEETKTLVRDDSLDQGDYSE